MSKYLSNRQKNLKLGIVSYTESNTVLEVTGKVGINTTNATSSLSVVGDVSITGVVTATTFFGSLTGTSTTSIISTYASTAGLATNIKGGNSGYIPYQSSTDTTTFVSSSTATLGQVLLWGGSSPTWGDIIIPSAGITIKDEGNVVGTASSITSINFVGPNVVVNAASGASGIATVTLSDYVSLSGISTYASTAGVATYSDASGVSTYASTAGVSTYASTAGVSTYASTAGVSTYATTAGIVTYATIAGVATYSDTSGVSTALQSSRTFEITGDIIASPISFNGTSNVSLAATIQPNSVGLGTNTFGDYVEIISGTLNQITVTGGTGERSTPTLSLPNNLVVPQDLTVTRDLQVNRNLNVTGNITIGGTTAFVNVQELVVTDPDIILGYRTDAFGNDVSNDNTANHGGVALASTEGNPLVNLVVAGIETAPATYKKIMWFKEGTFAGLGTDAWLINYAVGIGSTQFPTGTRLAAGSVQFTENDLSVVRNINATGVVTANSFSGNASSATYASSAGIATTATNLADAANITTGIINSSRLSGTYDINVSYATTSGISTYASTAGVATYASTAGVATYASTAGVATYASTAGVSTYASTAGVSTYASTAGVSTYASGAGISTVSEGLTGTPNISVGVVTATSFIKSGGTSGQFLKADGSVDANTYLTTTGSGVNLTGVVTSIVAGSNITISGSTGQVTINSTASGGGGVALDILEVMLFA